jgi:hypothetical protein
MYKIICIFFLFNCFHGYGQWIKSDSSKLIVEEFDFDTTYYHQSRDGNLYYCGLSYNVDSESARYETIYHKRDERSDLVYYKTTSLEDSSYEIGFYRLHFLCIDDKIVKCWKKDLICLYFDRSDKLIKQEFYDAGNGVNPQIYILKDASNK